MDHQTTVLSQFPPSKPFAILSIPGLTVADAIGRRPTSPLIHRNDARQTAINFVLGMPGMITGSNGAFPTALEYAVQQKPTLAIVALGFSEALSAATSGNPVLMPDPATFRANYSKLLAGLAATQADLVVMTIPDPMDTAHFSTAEAASRITKLSESTIGSQYSIRGNDRLLVNAVTEIGYHVMGKKTGPLPNGTTIPGALASDISNRGHALNR